MNWEKIYQEKLMSAEEAVDRFISSGDLVGFGGMIIAKDPMDALFQRIKEGKLHHITLVGDLLVDALPLDDPELKPEMVRYKSVFFGGYERKGYANGIVSFIPTQFNNYTRIMEEMNIKVGILPFAPPDEEGYLNLGPINASINPAVAENCQILIGQVNRKMPSACGHQGLRVHVSKFDALIEKDQPLTVYPVSEPNEIDRKVAEHILELIPDGATIQLGLGGMANAVGYGLECKKHLGVHTEMFTESMMYLMEKGVIDNSQKSFMPGVSVASFTLGSQKVYDFCNQNKDTFFGPFSFVNNVSNIVKNDNLISINNAMSVDLTGQVCAEAMGFRHFSGTGGQVDYVRGAVSAKGGKSFIALSSSYRAKDGTTQSKIILDFPAGGPTTTLRSDVQYVVTEYGCVNLLGKDLPERARQLIGIAHPQFREELEFAAKKNGLLY